MKKNRIEIGKEFERESFAYLKKIAKNVKWISEKKKSTFDFEIELEGRKYYVEAKYVSKGKPTLRKNQRNADFVITKRWGEIILIPKTSFKEMVKVCEKDITGLRVQPDTKKLAEKIKKLMEKKTNSRYSMDTIVNVALQRELKRIARLGK